MVSFPVVGRIVRLMKVALKKIVKQFLNKDNKIALPAVCGKKMQRKYQEMPFIFRPGISQPQEIYSCNSFYRSPRARRDLIFKTKKLWVLCKALGVSLGSSLGGMDRLIYSYMQIDSRALKPVFKRGGFVMRCTSHRQIQDGGGGIDF